MQLHLARSSRVGDLGTTDVATSVVPLLGGLSWGMSARQLATPFRTVAPGPDGEARREPQLTLDPLRLGLARWWPGNLGPGLLSPHRLAPWRLLACGGPKSDSFIVNPSKNFSKTVTKRFGEHLGVSLRENHLI